MNFNFEIEKQKMLVSFTENKIEIRKYPFNNFWCRKRIIHADEIDFVKFDLSILYICIGSSEILLIPESYTENLAQFVNKYSIKISEKVDVWELICYPFVDEQRQDWQLYENACMLRELGFNPDEVKHLRNRIERMMNFSVLLTMEYTSLLHCDVLDARHKIYFFNPFDSSFYWWTMKIALRGFGINPKKI